MTANSMWYIGQDSEVQKKKKDISQILGKSKFKKKKAKWEGMWGGDLKKDEQWL